jgi:mannose-6-phosphate isomerase-like protein (cupin superfamily)
MHHSSDIRRSQERSMTETIPGLVRAQDEGRSEVWDDETRGRIGFRTLFSREETATSGLTTGTAEVPPGGGLSAHRHPPAEVYRILEGEGVTTLDGVEHAVAAGDSVFIPGDVWHGIRNTGAAPLRLFYVLAADGMADVGYDFGSA